MTRILGRTDGDGETGHLGAYRARDGSEGAPVHVDLDGPHAALVVGKRGYGKSYTLGVLVEELARTEGVVPVVADPMGAFETFADRRDVAVEVVDSPRASADAIAPRAWCDLLGLDRESAAGSLVWRAASEASTLAGMREWVGGADVPAATRRAAENHLALAASWNAFSPDGLSATDFTTASGVVLNLAGYDAAAMNAVVRAVASGLYDARVAGRGPLPWLLVDEAHAFFDGVAGPALRTVLTRGRRPGVSLVTATQRPDALPEVAISQADLLVSHRLTSRADIDALSHARPTYARTSPADRMPAAPGEAVVVDDATESVHSVQVRKREVPHGGGSPSASDGGDFESDT
ncbi:ATP-binding protein [Halomicrococcus sp. SG-WS-1]|uniref:ATP-binding protein n=1 Tax=Halomicrococcus sp. SG-WS-1 TaxID=3439057 RepID=UPI003F793B2A